MKKSSFVTNPLSRLAILLSTQQLLMHKTEMAKESGGQPLPSLAKAAKRVAGANRKKALVSLHPSHDRKYSFSLINLISIKII
jgi:phosphopantetheinyl transferase (holo-ACP synthase)